MGIDPISCSLNPSIDPPLLLLIQLILQLQHLHQVFGYAVSDLNKVQAVDPTVEVSNPKDYLMIPDHLGDWGKLLKLILPQISH